MSLSDGIRKSMDMDNSQNSESHKAGENGEKSKNKSAGDPQQSTCYWYDIFFLNKKINGVQN